MNRAFGLVLLAMLGACGPEPAPVRAAAAAESEPQLWSIDYRFDTYSHSFAPSLPLSSSARGRLSLVWIDEPPLIVGALVLEDMQLRSAGQVVSRVEPGEWPLLARRSDRGAVDALWLTRDMSDEARNLARSLLAELSLSQGAGVQAEQTPVGELQARYISLVGPLMRLGVRARRSEPASAVRVFGLAALELDDLGLRSVGAGQVTRSTIGGHEELGTASVVVIRRESAKALTDNELSQLRATIEALSAAVPISLIEQPLSEGDKDHMRREAEPWEAVRARLLAAGAEPEPTLIHRAAAHLAVDDARVDELRGLLVEPRSSTAQMYLALGECGTAACQGILLDSFEQRNARAQREVLAGIARITAPSAETVDRLLAQHGGDDATLRSTLGIVLSRFAVIDPVGANERIGSVLEGMTDCPPGLDDLFVVIGNAGLPASMDVLTKCLDLAVEEGRRAAAIDSMRRIPGQEVTKLLVRAVVDDPSTVVRLAGLRALVVRELDDGELAPLVDAGVRRWGSSEWGTLLDVLERIDEPGPTVRALLVEIDGVDDEDVAARARTLLDGLDRTNGQLSTG